MKPIAVFAFVFVSLFFAPALHASSKCMWQPGFPVAIPSLVQTGDAAGYVRATCVGSALCDDDRVGQWLYCGKVDGKCPVSREFTAKDCAEGDYPRYTIDKLKADLIKPVNNTGDESIEKIEFCDKLSSEKYPVTVAERTGTDIYLGADFCLLGGRCDLTYTPNSKKAPAKATYVAVACTPDKDDQCPKTMEECFSGAPHTVNVALVKKTGRVLERHNVSSTGSASTTQTAGVVHTPGRR
ncbi:MAG: hypothetical protein KDD51_05045 [Bdellovibrionales bacterium]|nr:hypothetical protein [Bdellovibrionales bacterium]